jgi:hypothetical protein
MPGDTFFLMQSLGLVSGSFATINIPTGWTITYGPQQVILSQIPEPATWVAGLAGLAVIARRARRARC